MRLTLHTDYSLRVLIHVAVADGKLITIGNIAESFEISKQHLMKVVNDLSQKGYLDTVRGRGGGIRLRGSPRAINIGHVVRQTEDNLDVIGCLGQRGYCRIERVCVLRGVLHDATQAFLCCPGRIYTGRSDQAAQGVVVVVDARSARGARLITDSPAAIARPPAPTRSAKCWHGACWPRGSPRGTLLPAFTPFALAACSVARLSAMACRD